MKFTKIPAVLSIAGLDPSGGAGLIADIKTLLANGVYGMGAVTNITAQNTTGVKAVEPVPAGLLKQQIMTAADDIHPAAIKVGMVGTKPLLRTVEECIRLIGSPVVIDPVMISSSGTPLLSDEAREALFHLLPMALLITPNYPEAISLAGEEESPSLLARLIGDKYQTNVLVKGGHLSVPSDYLYLVSEKRAVSFPGLHIDNPNTHGTGCTLSSAIAANLAKGNSLTASVRLAKEYISTIISAGLDLGQGSGPMDHGAAIRGDFTERYSL